MKQHSMIGTVNIMVNHRHSKKNGLYMSLQPSYSNRDINKLFDAYNPNNIKSGDLVKVNLSHASYTARVVGLSLDIKNKKVYADLKLIEQNKRHPTRVDVSDCVASSMPLYPGHH